MSDSTIPVPPPPGVPPEAVERQRNRKVDPLEIERHGPVRHARRAMIRDEANEPGTLTGIARLLLEVLVVGEEIRDELRAANAVATPSKGKARAPKKRATKRRAARKTQP